MPRSDMCGVLQFREVARPFEWRAKSDNELIVEGYASVFDAPYEVNDPWRGPYTEVVDPKAFNQTLSAKPDLHLLINHEGAPLARTKSGTLELSTDDVGLKIWASLDRANSRVADLESAMARRDMDEMSFAFRTIRELWNDDEDERRLMEVSIDKGDVSVVNFGANPATSVSIQRALEAIAAGDERTLAEVRSSGVDLSAVQRNLGRTVKPTGPRLMTVAELLSLD